MFCRNCANDLDPKAVVCPACGFAPRQEKKFCHNCANPTEPNQAVCLKCGVALQGELSIGENRKLIAGLLGILLGWLGIHKFYLGYNTEGITMLVVSIAGYFLTCGIATSVMAVIGLIEGIMYLVKSDQEFEQTYIINKKGWF